MLSAKLFLTLFGLTTVHAIIRPGYGGHYGGNDGIDCDHPTKKPTTPKVTTISTTTTPAPTTTTQAPTTTTTVTLRPSCLSGWTLYERPDGPWCMKVITAVNISVSAGAALCASNNAVLTIYENDAERLAIVAEAQPYIMTTLQLGGGGSIVVAGNRLPQCDPRNLTTMVPICYSATQGFTIPASANTHPYFAWTTWAVDEPNNGAWTYESEDCIQLHIKPSDPKQHGLINDFYCELTSAPNSPNDSMFKNYGALCGQPAGLSANGK